MKKFLSGLVVSTMVLSSVPQTLVGAESINEEKHNQKEEESSEKSNNASVDVSTSNLKELETQRTEFSKTYEDINGQLYKEIYAEPVHAKTKDTFEEIDNTVSIDPSDKDILATENTSLVAEFPKNLQHDTGFTFKKGPHQVEFELTGAFKQGQKINPNLLSKTSLENNKVQYNDVYPDVDLRHITFNEEVKEDWIIKKYTGINQFSYTLRTKLKPVLQQDGSIDFLEKTGDAEAVFTLPAPEMMDSNINEGKGEGTYSKQLRYLLKENTNGTYNLVLDIDKEWLASSDRKYPIYVDPSVSIDALGDAYISSKAPTTNFNEKWDPVQGEYVLQTGYYDSTSGTNYAFIKFSVANELKGAVIDSASLQAYVTHAYYATQKNGLWVDEANSKWAINEVNWNNKPSSTKISSTLVGRDEWAKLDVKSTLQAWVSEERPNTGFKLHTNGNGQTYWKKITASESANKPKLVISYHYDQMPIPTMSAQLDNATAKTGSVNVNWKSVFGAKSYKLQMFDGYRYETVYTGSGLNWTSKDKKIFPKAPFSSSSRYKLDGTGTELPVDPSAFYSANLGSTTTAKAYKFRVIPVYPTGDGPSSTIISKEIPVPAGEPDLPTVTTGTYGEADTVNKGRGWLNVKWNKVANATGYKVRIWNGSVYKNYTVGKDTTSISTKGKKIWPTDDQIKAGVTDLYDVNFDDTASIAKGAELPIDPSTTYGSNSSRYSVRVIATSAAGDSPSSDVNYGYMKLYAPKNVSITANNDNLVQNKTSLTMKWSPSVGANYYEVQLNNGTSVEKYKVKGTTSFTTPKTIYELGKTYTANVVAFFDDDDTAYESEDGKVLGQRGLSDKSSTLNYNVPLRNDLLGVENYFTYDESIFGAGSSLVNVTTGNLILKFIDESLYTRGNLQYDFIRFYNSRKKSMSVLGKGWTFIGNETLTESIDGNVIYEDEDGTEHTFKRDVSGFKSPNGVYEHLQKNDNVYTLTDSNGFVQKYIQSTKTKVFVLDSYVDNNNNAINFKRNENSQIVEIQENRALNKSVKITLEYAGDKLSKLSYGDKWLKYAYEGDLLIQVAHGSVSTSNVITEKFVYDQDQQLTTYIDGNNNATMFKFTENEISILDKQSNSNDVSLVKNYHFDKKNNEFSVLDANDIKTVFKATTLDNMYLVNQLIESDDEESNKITNYELDEQYNVIKTIDSNDQVETNKYNTWGLLTSIQNSEGTLINEYDSKNNLTKTINPNGEVTLNTYSGYNLMSTLVGDEKSAYEYDEFGRKIKSTFADNTIETIKYDDSKNEITTMDKDGNETSIISSMYNQKIKETDALGNVKSYEYDPINSEMITAVTDAKGNKTKYKYDKNSNLIEMVDALGRIRNYTYNGNDRVESIKTLLMNFSYQYNENGDLSRQVSPSGKSINYSYNMDNQLEQVRTDNNSFNYNYDANGNLNTIIKNGSKLKNYEYDDQNGYLKKILLGSFNQSYSYDENSRLIRSVTDYNNEFSISKNLIYKENSDDVLNIKYSDQNNTIHDYSNKVNLDRNQVEISLNNGTFKKNIQVNDLSQMSSITYENQSSKIYEITYEHDKNNKITSESSNGITRKFVYDANDQLIKDIYSTGKINTYEYDMVGNITSMTVNGKNNTFTYNESNQIKNKNGMNYKYDLDGNLIKDENYSYEYDEFQKLISVKNNTGQNVAEYSYDENGIRTTKKVNDVTHEYFYNDDVLNMEIIKKGDAIQSYIIYEWKDSEPMGMIVKTKDEEGIFKTKAYHFITNHRGDVLRILNEVNNVVGSYEYDSYGNILNVSGDVAKENSIRYAGYYYDTETNNYYLQARYYNPSNAQFLSLDPYSGDDEEPSSQNGYSYVNGNPIMLTDHSGEIPKVISDAILYFAMPLIRKYRDMAIQKSRTRVIKQANKYLKYLGSSYYFEDPKKSKSFLVKIIQKTKKSHRRVFSIEFHSFSKLAYKRDGWKKTNKQYSKPIWHYHLIGETHYIIGEMIPAKVWIKLRKGFVIMW